MNVTTLHVERGREMRQLVQHDVVARGLSADAAMDQLADYLGISPEAVRLGIAIANEVDRPSGVDLQVRS